MLRTIGAATLYSEVAELLISRISQGAYSIGERLPSIRMLAQSLEVSVNTVRQAYDLLERRGYIDCRPQSGFFVRKGAPDEPAGSGASPNLVLADLPFCKIYGEIRDRSASPEAAAMGLALTSPDLLPDDQLGAIMTALMKREGPRMLDLSVGAGDKELRRQIARFQAEAGIALTADDILVTNGCSEAVYLALRALCQRGDVVAVESPAYFNFFEAFRELGLKPLEIPSDPRDGINVDVLGFAIAHHSPAVCLVSPTWSNPTGACVPDDSKAKLVRLLEEAGIPLIEDDAHGYLSWSSSRPPACKAFDRTGNVVYCSSFTKTMGAGLRLGWTAAGRYAEPMARLKAAMNLAGAGITQAAVASFLAEGSARHMRKLRSAMAQRVCAMRDLVAQAFPPGTRVSRPAGGILVWVELPDGRDADRLFEAAVEEDILFAPGSIFSASGGFKSFLRLNGSLAGPEVERALRRLGELASERCGS